MPRVIALGNGRLHVAYDALFRLRELTWPHVGQENHAGGHPSLLGVSVGEDFSWCWEPRWRRTFAHAPGTLVARTRLLSRRLGAALAIEETVLPDADVLLRRIRVRNLRAKSATVKVFLHHDLHVGESDLGDTALYDPASRAIVHYKRDRYVLVGLTGGVREFACGQKRFRNLEGTWRDAEDGKLSGNAIAHGSVDSVAAAAFRLAPREETEFHSWLALGRTWREAAAGAERASRDPEAALAEALRAWRARTRAAPDVPDALLATYRQSLAILSANLDHAGGILAAVDSDITSFNRDTYAYVWPRDGAFVAHALDLAGWHDASARYFRFLERAFAREAPPPLAALDPPGRPLLHKYTVDGDLASSWHAWWREGEAQLPIQEDESALTLWALAEHARLCGDWALALSLYPTLVRPLADFMIAYRDRHGLPLPSWDPWEERRGQLTYTACTVAVGLVAAATLAHRAGEEHDAHRYAEAAQQVRAAIPARLFSERHGRYLRRLDERGRPDPTMDASLVALAWFGLFPAAEKRVAATLDATFERLRVRTRVGGIARYENDDYHQVEKEDVARVPGNPWFVCTLWRADWLAARARDARELREARHVLEWAARRAHPGGAMAEQLHPRTGAPLSVSPLTWSHAAFVESCHRYRAAAAGLPDGASQAKRGKG